MSEFKRDFKLLLIAGLVVLGILLLALIFLPVVFLSLEPGVGLKMASIIGFFVTTTLFIVFAIFAGDGLLGEIQFMIGGFLLFFCIFTVMIAWVF